jgi:hypothetical protein
MDRKRKPEFQLDRDRYGEAVKSSLIGGELASENDRLEDNSEIRQRKIYKAKRLTRPGDPQGNRPQIKGKFKLLGSLTTAPVPTVNKVEAPKLFAKKDSPIESPKDQNKSGIFGNNSQKQNQTQPEPEQKQATFTTKKPEIKPIITPAPKATVTPEPKSTITPEPKSIFGVKTDDSKSVFVNKPDPEATKNINSVFGAPITNTKPVNIFASKSANNDKKDTSIFNKVDDKKTIGIFGKVDDKKSTEVLSKTDDNKSNGIFGKKDEKIELVVNKIEDKPKVSIFGSTAKSVSPFGSKETKPDQVKPLETVTKKEELPKVDETSKTQRIGMSLFGKPANDVEKIGLFGNKTPQSGCKYSFHVKSYNYI